MHYEKLANAATSLLARLSDIDGSLRAANIDLHADEGSFRDIFRKAVQPRGGAYWFFRPDGTVFDIGKADSNIWARIHHQAGTAVWHGDQLAKYEQTSGEGWGFPNSAHLGGGTSGDETMECVRAGTFHVGWISFDPGYDSTLMEVCRQTICGQVEDNLPQYCKKIG